MKKSQRILHLVKNNKVLVALFLVLIVATVYNAVYASIDLLNNSDNVIYPYLFGDRPLLDQMILPGKHPNIFKFPLFIAQTLFPYSPEAIIIVNVLTSLITVVGCALLLFLVFKRPLWKYILAASVLLSLMSPPLHNLIVYTTVRNFEFVVALALIIVTVKLLSVKAANKMLVISSALTATLMGIVISGDDYFIYVLIAPLIALVALHVITLGKIRKKDLYLLALLVGSTLLGKITAYILLSIGVYINNPNYLSEVSLTASEILIPSVTAASYQFLEVMGINFNGPVFAAIAINIVLILFILLGVYGFLLSIYRYFKKKDRSLSTYFVVASFVIFSATIGAYIFSGLVLQPAAYGDNTVLMNQRYIAFMPFLLLGAVVYGIEYALNNKTFRIKAAKPILIGLSILTLLSIPNIIATNTQKYALSSNLRASFRDTAEVLNSNDINVALTGYWYGSTIRLWSKDSIDFSVVAECNKPSITNARIDWYTSDSSVKKSALVIDTSGPDIPYLGYCTEKELHQIYGKPSYIVQSKGAVDKNKPINIWVYDYDVRTKVQKVDI